MPDLIKYARQIAQYNHYPVLINGLQPLYDYEVDGVQRPGLLSKYTAEWHEFCDAYAHKSHLHLLHEAADLLYYATQIEAQGGPVTPRSALAAMAAYDVSEQEAIVAAEAKYCFRAAKPGNKNEARELRLIEEAIQG